MKHKILGNCLILLVFSGFPGAIAQGNSEADRYLAVVDERLNRTWTVKNYAPPTIVFKIFRDGHVEDVRLVQTSGNEVVDKNALLNVQNWSPFPPLPQGSNEFIEHKLTYAPQQSGDTEIDYGHYMAMIGKKLNLTWTEKAQCTL